MEEIADGAILLDFMVEAPDEIPGAVRHFAACRSACAGIIPIGLTMGGRYIRTEAIEALEGESDRALIEAFDAFADQINQLNNEEEEEESTAVGTEARGVHV